MALFKKMKQAFGGDDRELLESGQLGRAEVMDVAIKGMSVQHGAMPPEQVCEFKLQVYLDDTAPFEAITRKRVPI